MNELSKLYPKHKVIAGTAVIALAVYSLSSLMVSADAGHDHGAVIEVGQSEFPVVTVVNAQRPEVDRQFIEASGEILPVLDASIYPNQEGIVEELLVDIGSQVYQGQVIGYLKPSPEQLRLHSELQKGQEELAVSLEKEGLLNQFDSLAQDSSQVSSSRGNVYAAEVYKIDSEITALKLRQQQLESLKRSGSLDVISTVGSVLFETDNIKSVVDSSNRRIYFRSELARTSSSKMIQIADRYSDVYKAISAETTALSKALISEIIILGNDVRLLSDRLMQSGELSTDKIKDLRGDLDESIDHLLEIADEITTLEGESVILERSKGQVASQVQLEQINANLDVRLNTIAVKNIERQMNAGLAITAPFGGVITRRHVSIGDVASFDRPLFDIVDDSKQFIRFFVSQEAFPFISEGTIVEYQPHALLTAKAQALVSRISRTVDKQTKTILIEADLLPDAEVRILSHMNVRVFIPVAFEKDVVSVPLKALSLSGTGSSVWVVNENIELSERPVTVVYRKDGRAYIGEGVTENEWVVIKSPVAVKEGLAVDTKI